MNSDVEMLLKHVMRERGRDHVANLALVDAILDNQPNTDEAMVWEADFRTRRGTIMFTKSGSAHYQTYIYFKHQRDRWRMRQRRITVSPTDDLASLIINNLAIFR